MSSPSLFYTWPSKLNKKSSKFTLLLAFYYGVSSIFLSLDSHIITMIECFKHSNFNSNGFVNPSYLRNDHSQVFSSVKSHNQISTRLPLKSHKVDGTVIDSEITPLPGLMLIKRQSPEKVTSGGLFLPSDAQESKILGEVLAVGKPSIDVDTCKEISPVANVGDVVVFSQSGISEIKYDDQDCLILRNEDILAKVNAKGDQFNEKSIQPLSDVVFLKVNDKQEKSSGGLFIVSESNDRNYRNTGVVISKGPGIALKNSTIVPTDVNIGDTVYFFSYSVDDATLKMGKDKYAFVHSRDILAKWNL